MARRRLANDIIWALGRDAAAITTTSTTQNATAFDRLQTNNPADDVLAIVDVGTWTTDGSLTVHLEESTDNSTWTDVAAAEVVVGGAAAASPPSGTSASDWVIDGTADDDTTAVFGYLGDARYVRVSIDVSGQTTGSLAAVGVWYVAGNLRNQIDRVANASA